MRKAGAKIRHRNDHVSGLVAQALKPEYETRLRLAVDSLRDGWMGVSQFNDLADTIDMLRIGIGSCAYQKPDQGTMIAIEVAWEALNSIYERYHAKKVFGATGEELKAVHLLADTALDYWNRRSGTLFQFSYMQLQEIRKEQQAKLKEEKEAA